MENLSFELANDEDQDALTIKGIGGVARNAILASRKAQCVHICCVIIYSGITSHRQAMTFNYIFNSNTHIHVRINVLIAELV